MPVAPLEFQTLPNATSSSTLAPVDPLASLATRSAVPTKATAPPSSCTRSHLPNSTWSGKLRFERLNLYFSLAVQLHRARPAAGARLPSLRRSFDASLRVHAKSRGMPVAKLIYESEATLRLSCRANTRQCDTMDLLAERQYQYSLVKSYDSFNVTITYYDFDFLQYGEPVYELTYHDILFKQVEMTLHGLFLVLTSLLLLYWLRRLYLQGWATILREQIWISLLLVTLLFYQNPFFIPLMFNQVRILWLLSGSSELLAVGSMLLFWLLFVSGIGGVYEKQTFSKFYGRKLVLFCVFVGCTQALVFMSDSVVVNANSETKLDSNERRSYAISIALAAIVGICLIVWVVWFFRETNAAKARLRRMPYVSTRFWQLSFRFFIGLSVAVIVYFVAFVIIRAVERSMYFGIYQESLATFMIVSVYVQMLAIVYLPIIRPRRRRRMKGHRRKSTSGGGDLADYQAMSDNESEDEFFVGYDTEDEDDHDGLFSWLPRVPAPIRTLFQDRPTWWPEATMDGASSSSANHMRSSAANPFSSRIGSSPKTRASGSQLAQDSAGGWHTVTAKPDALRILTEELSADRRDMNVIIGASSGNKDSPIFSIERALVLSLFSYQAYFDMPDAPPSQHSFGHIDLVSQFDFSVVRAISGDQDTHVIVARRGQVLVIAFRGTVSKKNLATDLKFSRIPLPLRMRRRHTSYIDIDSPKVHSGFWTAYASLRAPLIATVRGIRDESLNPIRVLVTGHSLGGSMACLCAYELSMELHLDVQAYTLGAPRLGNHSFADLYDEVVPVTFRLCFDRDFITTIPKVFCMYKHVGVEVILDRIGNFIVDPLAVEKIFRDTRHSLQDHRIANYLGGLRHGCRLYNLPAQYVEMPADLNIVDRDLIEDDDDDDDDGYPDVEDVYAGNRRRSDDWRTSEGDVYFVGHVAADDDNDDDLEAGVRSPPSDLLVEPEFDPSRSHSQSKSSKSKKAKKKKKKKKKRKKKQDSGSDSDSDEDAAGGALDPSMWANDESFGRDASSLIIGSDDMDGADLFTGSDAIYAAEPVKLDKAGGRGRKSKRRG